MKNFCVDVLNADFPISGHEYVWKYTWNDWVLRRFNIQCFSQVCMDITKQNHRLNT